MNGSGLAAKGITEPLLIPQTSLIPSFLLNMFSLDLFLAQARFRGFNERTNQDKCLEDHGDFRRRLTDDEARLEIRKYNKLEIYQLLSLPKEERDRMLKESEED